MNTNNRRHFFFKQGAGNCGFHTIKKNVDDNLDSGKREPFELGVFFSSLLTENTTQNDLETTRELSKNKKQICSFINLEKDDCLWLFDREIYCFKCVDKKIREYPAGSHNTPEYLNEGMDGISAKVKTFELVKRKKLEEVSEMFSTTSSNLSYNRRTIVEFEQNTHYDICEHILSGNPIKINKDNFITHLSPSQFETLNFLIFYFSGKIPKSHVGRSRKYIDLEVLDPKTGYTVFYQVKKYDLKNDQKLRKEIRDKDIWLIHTGKTDNSKMMLGKEWVLSQIYTPKINCTTLTSVKDWVSYLFPKKLFDVHDMCK